MNLASIPAGNYLQSPPVAGSKKDAGAYFLPRNVSRTFGQRLQTLRRERNFTQLRLAWDFGIDLNHIRDVEEGRVCISLVTLELIALGMNLPLSVLLQDL